jgi:exodeoxyribonuclease VII large subunit
MQTALGNRLMKENHRLQLREQQVKAASPEHLLKKGYSITLVNGKAVKDASLLKKGDTLVTLLYNGKIESEVK